MLVLQVQSTLPVQSFPLMESNPFLPLHDRPSHVLAIQFLKGTLQLPKNLIQSPQLENCLVMLSLDPRPLKVNFPLCTLNLVVGSENLLNVDHSSSQSWRTLGQTRLLDCFNPCRVINFEPSNPVTTSLQPGRPSNAEKDKNSKPNYQDYQIINLARRNSSRFKSRDPFKIIAYASVFFISRRPARALFSIGTRSNDGSTS